MTDPKKTGRPGLRKPYERHRTITVCEGESATDPSFSNETDVNNIISRFARTGEMPPGSPGQYADVSGLQGDLTELIEDGKKATSELREAREKQQRDAIEKEKLEKQKLMQRVKELEEASQKNAGQPGGDEV